MANIKQTILIREDLNFPRGLLAAQVAHIHMEHFRITMLNSKDSAYDIYQSGVDNTCLDWLKNPYIYVHGVPNKEVLEHYISLCEKNRVRCIPWTDTVNIPVHDNFTLVLSDILIGVSLGPDDSDKIKAIIGSLPLLK